MSMRTTKTTIRMTGTKRTKTRMTIMMKRMKISGIRMIMKRTKNTKIPMTGNMRMMRNPIDDRE